MSSVPKTVTIIPEWGVSALKLYYSVLLGVTIAFLVTTFGSVALRVYVKMKILKAMSWSDWTMLLAQTFFTSNCVMTIAMVICTRPYLDAADIQSLENDSVVINLRRAINVNYTVMMLLTKTSLALFFLTIFKPTTHAIQRLLVHFTLVISWLPGVAYIIFGIATCAFSFCSNIHALVSLSIAWSAINATTDLLYSALAIHMTSTLSLTLKDKLPIGGLLVFGTLGGLASVIRLVVQTSDLPPYVVPVIVGRWSIIEAGICITAACLATLRPLFRALRQGSRARREDDAFTMYTTKSLTQSKSRVEVGSPHIAREGGKGIVVVREVSVTQGERSESFSSLRCFRPRGTPGSMEEIEFITGLAVTPGLEEVEQLEFEAKEDV